MTYLIFIIILSVFFSFVKVVRIRFTQYYYNVADTVKKIYRLLKVKKRGIIVWQELIALHKSQNWHFGQFENDNYILTTFLLNGENAHQFKYEITDYTLEYQTYILNEFEDDKTTDLMILASHLNSMYQFGKVNVNIKNNYVEFVYSGDLMTYTLYSSEINNDISMHYNIAKNCHWAFSNLLATDEDPVFVIAELVKKLDDEAKTTNR